ncbi:SET domain-containing protein-lysine N-methyltransferase [Aquimarina sp. TRL1]|uniref:SET domain-containing protein-lysine N-methyltransferase n=1 Tax=Aquimarina sp. (strain TRL1) TaxID=2736252 RepID=UPI00158A2C70|nr:SET domain-containing protein-lysine N-methyltransferase [Aquimarina sp. TRL1]QKX06466.1 SET domain-containing protein-lysine N-methyltransferase [Aquimarina sp. TRL1]
MNKVKKTTLKGDGVFAEISYKKEETVLVGRIEKELTANHSHASQIGLDRFVFHNEIIRMVNHSCNPNCGIKVNPTGAHNIVAMRDILKGEEITFDYAMRNYTVQYFPSLCKCGAEQCRGKITGWKDLPINKKEEYSRWAAPYLLELDAVNLS